MKTSANAFRGLWFIAAVALWCSGCVGVSSGGATQASSSIGGPTKMRIVAAVVKASHEIKGIRWLDLSDSEFESVKRDLETRPPPFKFAQLKEKQLATDDDVLSINEIKVAPPGVEVRVTFSTVRGFVMYIYKLIPEGGHWKVTARDFYGAS